MGSDTNTNSYSSDGRIKQIEYAMKASHLGTSIIAVKLEDSIIFVSEKKVVNKLQVVPESQKHFKIYDKILMGCSGIMTDLPSIIQKCRNLCADHDLVYDEQIPIEKLLNEICYLALQFSSDDFDKKIYSRPFGVSMVIGAIESDGPKLYFIDSSGSFVPFNACSIGSAYEVITSELKKSYTTFTDTEITIKKLIEILKNSMKDPMTRENVEISILSNSGIQNYSKEEIESLI